MKTKLKLTFLFLLVFFLFIQISCKSENSDNPAAPVLKVSSPTFNPVTNTEFTGSQEITIACATDGATIRYTTDGTTPSDTVGTVYTAAFTITVNTAVIAVAYKAEMTTSDVAGAYYAKSGSVTNPRISPVDGSSFTGPREVAITTATSGATVKYTLDNTDPKTSGTAITGTADSSTVSFSITTTKTIKAYAFKSGMEDSGVVIAILTRVYIVAFDKLSGSGGSDSVNAVYGTAMPAATAPARSGYFFTGYYDATSGGNQYYTAGMASARNWDKTIDITLYARWTLQCTVTFDKRNGDGGSDSVNAVYGTAMPAATAPAINGYTFEGYFDAISGGNQYYTAGMASARNWDKTSDITLYARWTPNQYTVTFNKQSGSGGSDSVNAVYNAAMPAATAPVRSGYMFIGYFDAISGGNQYYTAGMASARNWYKTIDITLYARWTLQYTVNFDKRSGDGGSDSVNAVYGSAMPSATAPTRSGYTFIGYFDAISGGNQYYTEAMVSARNWDKTSDTTLYARWVPQYIVTYNENGNTGGSVPASQTQDSGTTITVRANTGNLVRTPAAGTGEAYKFGGWQTVSGGVGGTYYPAGTGTFTLTGNITLYARWVKFELRDTGPGGGLVFYDKGSYSDGWRYLEAAPQSTERNSAVWGDDHSRVTGADGTAVGSGKQNTLDIVTQFGGADPNGVVDYAAKVCSDLVCGGYSDWFLPSKDELNLMYVNLKVHGVGGFDGAFLEYWSSSECSLGAAWFQRFYDGTQVNNYAKTNINRVRAVRWF